MRPTGSPPDERVRGLLAPDEDHGPSSAGRPGRWGACAVAALVGLTVLLLVRAFVAEPVEIPTSSMAGTLLPGDHALVEKTQLFRPWHRGDVVLFRAPGSGTLSIKRIVGLPGESVAIRDGRLFVDGHYVHEEYVTSGAIDSVYYGPRRVGTSEVLVLGDNRRNSRDSRAYGGVPVSLIEGRVVAVIWPLGRAGGVR